MKNAFGCRNGKDWALLALRIALGVIFIYHGWGKLFGNAPGMTAFTGMLTTLGVPAPAFFAYVVALSEFIGGIAILLGVYAHVFAVLTAIIMLVAWGLAKKFALPAGDADLALLAASIAVVLMGAGRYSVAAMMGKNPGGCCDHGSDCCDGKSSEKKK